MKVALWLYYIFDMVGYAVKILIDVLYIFKVTSPYLAYTNDALEFLFPFIQALGICFFKSSTDPLSNISSLVFYKIVSSNQVPTDSYWCSMIKDITIESE